MVATATFGTDWTTAGAFYARSHRRVVCRFLAPQSRQRRGRGPAGSWPHRVVFGVRRRVSGQRDVTRLPPAARAARAGSALFSTSWNSDIAAMTVLCPYFEAIGGYLAGEDTNGNSKMFFIKGFYAVFRADSPEIQKAAKAVYKYIRCGLAHEGMLSHKVHYSSAGAKAFFFTYRKKEDGTFDMDAGIVSMIVNPLRIYQAVVQHFDEYIRALREAKDQALVEAFRRSVDRQWALGTSENIIGMTEAEFLGHS